MATAVLIPMHDIESSLLKQIGHCAETFTLSARFLPGKNSPAGKVYHYSGVSEEIWDDIDNPKGGETSGQAFTRIIKKNPDKYPYACVDEGVKHSATIEAAPAASDPVPQQAVAEVLPPEIPDDEEGLKNLAMATRTEATALTITTSAECEAASIEVLRVRAQRKLAIEKVNKIKIPATAAWKAACDLFNEIDGRYAEAERYLDGGILQYRAAERQRAAVEAARLAREQQQAREKAEREQREEFERQQRAAEAEAKERAAQLAQEDAKAAEAQGAPAEVVQAIIDNPLPVTVRHVAPPALAYVHVPAPIVQQNIPTVAGLGFTTEWLYEITDESQIPLTHDYFSLDPKKINAKVQSLKKHANIPGVRVYSEERSIKRTGKGK